MSVWFDYTTYLNNKVALLQKTDKAGDWTLPKVMQAFAEAGFGGEAGAEQHFVQFGQYEDVAPNAFFNPMEYYRAKAAEVYGKQNAPQTVTEIEVNEVMLAIKGLKMGAWTHFKTFGNNEHVNPSNQFDSDAYVAAKVIALNAVRPDGQAEYTAKDVYAAFQGMGISALEHFMMFGGDATKGEVPYTYNGTIPSVFEVPLEKQVKPDNSNAGYTFSLTADSDIINSTTNSTGKPSATAFASALDDTFVAGVANSLNAGDNLDGAGGHNTLRIVGSAAGSANLRDVTLANIQTVELTGTVVTTSTGSVIDASMHKGVVKDLVLNNITASAANDLVASADISQTVTLSGKIQVAASQDVKITYTGLSTTGADDSALLKLNSLALTDGASTNGAGLTVDGVENLTLNLTGTNDFVTLSDTGLKNLTLTGPGTAKGTVETSSGATIAKIDASTAGGADLTIDTADMAAAGFTYAGSKNSDKLAITTASNTQKLTIDLGDGDNQLSYVAHSSGMASGSSFKAGAGTKDKLVIAASNSTAAEVTSTVASAFSGFEVLSTALDGLNVSMFKDITSVEVTGNAGLTGLSAKQAEDILITGSTDIGTSAKIFALKDPTGSGDAIGFTLKHASGGSAELDADVSINGIESLTVKAESGVKTIVDKTAGTDYSTFKLSSATELKSVTLTGDYALKFDASNASTTKITDINASTNTAGVDIAIAGQTGALKVTGSAKADNIAIGTIGVGGSLNINAGDGNDTVSGALVDIKKSIIDGGAGNDVLEITGTTLTLADSDLKGITNFETLNLSGAITAGGVTLGAYASDLAATNNGVLKITAESMVVSTSTYTIDTSAMRSTAGIDLSLTNTGTGGSFDITGTDSNDVIKVTLANTGGGSEALEINGGKGDDVITVIAASAYSGSASAINGGAGNDTITGSAVADIIIGGAGADIMTGGAGADKFSYDGLGQSNGTEIDWIKDFVANTDKINLKVGAEVVLKGVTLVSGASATTVTVKDAITLTSAADLADLQTQLKDSDAVKTAYTGSTGANSANGLQVGIIEVTNGAFAGKYILINDATAGYNAADDMLINVTGINTATPLAAGDFTFTA